MAIIYNDQDDIYNDPQRPRFGGAPDRYGRDPSKGMRQAAELMYGNVGKFGMTLSVARTYVGQLFDGARMRAQVDGHRGDFPTLEAEARALANFAHQNLTQDELQQIVRTFGPFMKTISASALRDDDKFEDARVAGVKALVKKHGVAGYEEKVAAASQAAARLSGAGLSRTLHEDGAGNDPDVVEYLASLAYAKGWATQPKRPTLTFEPPRAA